MKTFIIIVFVVLFVIIIGVVTFNSTKKRKADIISKLNYLKFFKNRYYYCHPSIGTRMIIVKTNCPRCGKLVKKGNVYFGEEISLSGFVCKSCGEVKPAFEIN